MGVGAIFISTLATLRLEEPQNPPQNQQQLLASTLQPIVAFVVLGSIIIRASSSIVLLFMFIASRRWSLYPFFLVWPQGTLSHRVAVQIILQKRRYS